MPESASSAPSSIHASRGADAAAEREQRREWSRARRQAWLGVVVAWVAGFVDAVGFLTLYGLFTANMSGNSVRLGLAVGVPNWATALFRFTPILGFVIGVALGSAVLEVAARRHMRPQVAVILGLESLLLAAYAVCRSIWPPGTLWRPADGAFYLFAALLTLAMGLQNTTLRRVGNRIIHTTFVTGMLTEVTIESVKLLFWFGDHLCGRGAHRLKRALVVTRRQASFNRLLALVSIWACYVLGAAAGTIGTLRWGSVALAAPIVVLLAIATADIIKPVYPTAEAEGQADVTQNTPRQKR
ncbi:MAG: YoaK family protein [Ktedonobacterales bacterium]